MRLLRVIALASSLGILLPLAVLVLHTGSVQGDPVWKHFYEVQFIELISNTLLLMGGTALGTLGLGVTAAWFNASCEYPGRRFFDWALVLPLALPAYVTGFAYISLFDISGPLHSYLQSQGIEAALPIRSASGLMLVLSLALYPYVYLLSRAAFASNGRRALEAARSLGAGVWSAFFRINLGLARPFAIGGLLLVWMEALADFGTVSLFNFDTFSLAIYRAWFGYFSLSTAARLALMLVLLVLVLIGLERYFSRRRRYIAEDAGQGHGYRIVLGPRGRVVALSFVSGLFGLAFVLPVLQLLYWSSLSVKQHGLDQRLFWYSVQSLGIAFPAAILATTGALFLAHARRMVPEVIVRLTVRLSTMGYALPGAVLAVGIFIPLIALDRFVVDSWRNLTGEEIGLIFTGTILAMVVALAIRFLAVAYNGLSGSLTRVSRSLDEAALNLGAGVWSVLYRIHLPLLKTGFFSALLLVFVDVLKEMPITLMMRPFGLTPLSVNVFELTSEGQWAQAALPALFLVLAGLPAVIYLTRMSGRRGQNGATP